jgi:hypothetical protein
VRGEEGSRQTWEENNVPLRLRAEVRGDASLAEEHVEVVEVPVVDLVGEVLAARDHAAHQRARVVVAQVLGLPANQLQDAQRMAGHARLLAEVTVYLSGLDAALRVLREAGEEGGGKKLAQTSRTSRIYERRV